MKDDWPHTCETKAHRGRAIPARDVYTEKRSNIRYYLCGPCSESIGPLLKRRGWAYKSIHQEIPPNYSDIGGNRDG